MRIAMSYSCLLLLLGILTAPVFASASSTTPVLRTGEPQRNAVRAELLSALRASLRPTATISGTRLSATAPAVLALNYHGAAELRQLGLWAPRPIPDWQPPGPPIDRKAPDTNGTETETCDSESSSDSLDCSVYRDSCKTPSPPPSCFKTAAFLTHADYCSPSEADTAWTVASPTIPANGSLRLQGVSFPVPAGTGSLVATWTHYMDLPNKSGYVQFVEFRFHKGGSWSTWRNSSPSGTLRTGPEQAWTTNLDHLPEAAQADSVQLRYRLECIPSLSVGGAGCPSLLPGIYYDDLGLFAITGVPPAPFFGVAPVALAQSTFVDGTMTGTNCTIVPCWPGIRGSQTPEPPGQPNIDIRDNFNSPLGDSIVFAIRSPLRTNGKGINWRQGFDKTINGGATIARTNASYNASFDPPRVIYRLFDPATKTWSPFDSSSLDADNVSVAGGDTVLVGSAFRMDWPPRDKAGLSLPAGFTINGLGAYNSLSFLPRGTRLQYYFKAVDIQGNVLYQFQADEPASEVEDLPTLPGGSVKAPDILEFAVLPRVYPPGSPGSLLAGRTNSPILNLDGAYTRWSFGVDPVTQALRGLGVRADRFRLLQGIGYGNNIGGHELNGAPDNQAPYRPTNYFPNMTEYAIRDSLSGWYKILIQSSHVRLTTLEDEADARLLEEWWNSSTGSNSGDRCIFVSGDDYLDALMNPPAGEAGARRQSFGQNVLGVTSAASAWNGTASVFYPVIEDRFSNPAAGPALIAGFGYPVDGGCPGPNRFDTLTRMAIPEAQDCVFYPSFGGTTQVAGVALNMERDPVPDKDRNKALSHAMSIQFIRKAGIPTVGINYVHSGIDERMKVLYKFLASCRGARTSTPSDTGKCWPCPTDPSMNANWASLAGFQAGTYGPLYPIQDHLAATAIDSDPSAAPRAQNRLGQNRPNPFNPITVIPYSTAKSGRVTIRIYDIGGRLIRTLVDDYVNEGDYEARWDGRLDSGVRAGSGVFFYRIGYPGGGFSGKKMILLK